MRICISSTGTDLTSPMDPRFGRATCLLVVDDESGEVIQLADATGGAHGAGVQAARSAINSGAAAVVTGQIGPRAFEVLSAAGIAVYLAPAGTVGGAIQDLNAGRLEAIAAPSGPSHAGMRG
jgi:predicted Fe-Mo cluster-binding NifX family protein